MNIDAFVILNSNSMTMFSALTDLVQLLEYESIPESKNAYN